MANNDKKFNERDIMPQMISILNDVWFGADGDTLNAFRSLVKENLEILDSLDYVSKKDKDIVFYLNSLLPLFPSNYNHDGSLIHDPEDCGGFYLEYNLLDESIKRIEDDYYNDAYKNVTYPKVNEQFGTGMLPERTTCVEYELIECNQRKLGHIYEIKEEMVYISLYDRFYVDQMADYLTRYADYGEFTSWESYYIAIPIAACRVGHLEDGCTKKEDELSLEEKYLRDKGAWVGYPSSKTNIYSIGEHTEKVVDYCIKHGASEELIKAAWLHDAGKIDDVIKGKYQHNAGYCQKSVDIARDLGESEYVVDLIKYHNPVQGGACGSVEELIMRGYDWCRDLATLVKADCFASCPDDENPEYFPYGYFMNCMYIADMITRYLGEE